MVLRLDLMVNIFVIDQVQKTFNTHMQITPDISVWASFMIELIQTQFWQKLKSVNLII